jgi:hypothetical protein
MGSARDATQAGMYPRRSVVFVAPFLVAAAVAGSGDERVSRETFTSVGTVSVAVAGRTLYESYSPGEGFDRLRLPAAGTVFAVKPKGPNWT